MGVRRSLAAFTIDVWEEDPCGTGATICPAGLVQDCDWEDINPVTWGCCEVDVN